MKTDGDGETLLAILKSQVNYYWERFGLERVAVTRDTLRQFRAGAPPELVRSTSRKRISTKVVKRSTRGFNNVNSFLASWPEDAQAIFSYPALAYVVRGTADFPVGDYVVQCAQDHFIVFSDNVPRPTGSRPHLEGADIEKRHCSVLWFFAPPGTNSVIAYICRSHGQKHWCDQKLDYHSVHGAEVTNFFKLFLREAQEKPRGYELVVRHSFQTFLLLFMRALEEGQFHHAGRSSASHFEESGSSQIELAQQYIKSHLNQPLTAPMVAHEVFMSRNSFMQHFSRETGQTFHEYVTRERMEKARELLRDGYWSLAFISKFIGLRPTQFRLQFKKYFGIAPSEFRRLHRNGQNR